MKLCKCILIGVLLCCSMTLGHDEVTNDRRVLDLDVDGVSERDVRNRPNFLFILGDDVTYNDLGCFGGKNAKTPNIDRLASEGIRFNRAYCAMSMCAPFRAELYT